MDTQNHPVWNLYDEMRTARLNVKCLEAEVRSLRGWNNLFEVTIAISATSSISGFWFLQNLVGGYIWKTVGAIAVIVTILKPVLRFADKARHKQELLASYKILDHDLHCVCLEVRHQKRYDDEHHKELVKALKRKAELVKKSDDSSLSVKVRRECEEQVRKELPVDSFYIPA